MAHLVGLKVYSRDISMVECQILQDNSKSTYFMISKNGFPMMIGNLFAISLLEGAVQIVTSFQMHQNLLGVQRLHLSRGLAFEVSYNRVFLLKHVFFLNYPRGQRGCLFSLFTCIKKQNLLGFSLSNGSPPWPVIPCKDASLTKSTFLSLFFMIFSLFCHGCL